MLSAYRRRPDPWVPHLVFKALLHLVCPQDGLIPSLPCELQHKSHLTSCGQEALPPLGSHPCRDHTGPLPTLSSRSPTRSQECVPRRREHWRANRRVSLSSVRPEAF